MARACDNCNGRSGQSATEMVEGRGASFWVCPACVRQYGLPELRRWMSQSWLPLGRPRRVEADEPAPLRRRRRMTFDRE